MEIHGFTIYSLLVVYYIVNVWMAVIFEPNGVYKVMTMTELETITWIEIIGVILLFPATVTFLIIFSVERLLKLIFLPIKEHLKLDKPIFRKDK